MSVTDSLTGLYNRHKLKDVLSSEMARFNRYNTDFSIILIDIDYFKAEKLRSKVQNHEFPAAGNVTISSGVAQYTKEETTSNLVSRADKALYEAKKKVEIKWLLLSSAFLYVLKKL